MTEFLALWPYFVLAGFVLFAYTAEAMTGFGSIVIALSLGAMLFPIDFLQTLLVPLNICMTGFLSWRHRRSVDGALLAKIILPYMLLGTGIGVVLQPILGGQMLKVAFALLVLWFAVRALMQDPSAIPKPKPRWWSPVIVTGAGVTHGLFASGGPLLVYGLAGMSLDKARFRASLIVVWFSLNSVLTVLFLQQGRLQPMFSTVLAFLPLIPLGIWLGEKLHHKVDDAAFRVWIYRILVLSAAGLLLSGLRG